MEPFIVFFKRTAFAMQRIMNNFYLKLRYRDRIFFDSWKLWQYTIKKNFQIDPMEDLETQNKTKLQIFLSRHVRICENCLFKGSSSITIQERVLVGRGCIIGSNSREGVTVMRDTLLAENISIRDTNHAFSDPFKLIRQQGVICAPIIIGEDVWISYGACIHKGVSIGKGCVIGANAVLNKNTEPYTIWGGVPAKQIGCRGNN